MPSKVPYRLILKFENKTEGKCLSSMHKIMKIKFDTTSSLKEITCSCKCVCRYIKLNQFE